MNRNKIATEIVSFKTINGISGNELIKILDDLEANFLSKTKSYIDSELVAGKEGQTWMMIVHWRTMEEAHEAIKEFMHSPLTEEYRSTLDPKSVSLHLGEQRQIWNGVN